MKNDNKPSVVFCGNNFLHHQFAKECRMMNQDLFLKTVSEKSEQFNINPLLLLSGIEGLYTFKDVQMNAINYDLLDSLILTVFALRIGDTFHTMAEENLSNSNSSVQLAAIQELMEMTPEEIKESKSSYLQSFAQLIGHKSPVRNYHVKALEVAAIEIRKAQIIFENKSIGSIIFAICKDDTENKLGLAELFNS